MSLHSASKLSVSKIKIPKLVILPEFPYYGTFDPWFVSNVGMYIKEDSIRKLTQLRSPNADLENLVNIFMMIILPRRQKKPITW